jgi:uncharacterized membrane protein
MPSHDPTEWRWDAVAHDPVHLFIGLYDSAELAERDLDGLKKLHAEGLAGTYDAAVVTRDAEGRPRVDRRKRSGHAVWTGAGVGAVFGVLFPPAIVPMALVGAGAGVLVKHMEDGLSKKDAEDLADALGSGEAALAVVSDEIGTERLAQVFPGAGRRIAKVLDVEKDDFAAALRQAMEEE